MSRCDRPEGGAGPAPAPWVLVVLVSCASLDGCTTGGDRGSGDLAEGVGCDPDDFEACPLDGWTCRQGAAGLGECTTACLPRPDCGSWSCQVREGELLCSAELFEPDESWACTASGPDRPRACERADGWSCSGGEVLAGNDWAEGSSASCVASLEGRGAMTSGQWACEVARDGLRCVELEVRREVRCVPGAERVCHEQEYCGYGVERCRDDGEGFGPCVEAPPPGGCGRSWDEGCCALSGACCSVVLDAEVVSVGACEDVLL